MSKTKTAIDPEIVHSAITTWSGFVYQGKLALYHTLTLLAADRTSDNCFLQLDSLEDFAVLDPSKKALSMHQIKAYKTLYYSAYKADFEQLVTKAKRFDCNDYRFHMAREIKDKTVTAIEAAHPNMKVYKYSDGNCHCSLNKVDGLLEEAIKAYYIAWEPGNTWKLTPDYLTITRNVLEDVIQDKVIKIHQKVHLSLGSDNFNAYTEFIPFQDFSDLLSQNLNARVSGKEYFFFLIKRDLNVYHQDFCVECSETLDAAGKIKMYKYLCYINMLNDMELVKFIRRIMPQRQFAFNTIYDYKHQNIHAEEMKDAFFEALMQFRLIDNLPASPFGWKEAPAAFLVPTTISRQQDKAAHVCEAIIENVKETDLDLPYQTSNLITSQMDVLSVYGSLQNIVTASGDEDAEAAENNITRWKNISLTSIAKAKTIIK
jgi:hypothetical protein